MKTPEQLKGIIRSMAEKKNLRAQEVLQMFLFERIIDRLAGSDYKKNFILKGGLLISSMLGISERTTMDMILLFGESRWMKRKLLRLSKKFSL